MSMYCFFLLMMAVSGVGAFKLEASSSSLSLATMRAAGPPRGTFSITSFPTTRSGSTTTQSTATSSRKSFISSAILSVATAPASMALAAPPKVYETDSGVLYVVKEEGRGQSPRKGDYCVVSYVAYLNNGKVFDASDAPGRKPIAFKLGAKQVIPGWEDVLPYMKPGAVFNIVVPPKLGYGDKGICVENNECLVPPNETLKYMLKLERVAISP